VTRGELPRTTGVHAVGRRAIDWIDEARSDPYARRAGAVREVPVVIWYPSESTDRASARYLPRGFWLHSLVFGVVNRRVVTHSVENAPVVRVPAERYPVLLFSPAGWPPYFYGALLEELASHGYVVVGLQHPYEMVPTTVFASGRRRWFRTKAVAGALSVSDRPHADDVTDRGRVVDVKAEDLLFVLDQLDALGVSDDPLAGRLDLERVGAFGHSFGGGAAVVAAQRDVRFRACANLDGGLWRAAEECHIDRPTLVIFAEHPEMVQPCHVSVEQKIFSSVEWCELDRALHRAAWTTLVDSATPGYSAQIRGAEHRTFMDWRVLQLRRWSIGKMGNATIDGRRMWDATTRLLRSFFDAHVRGTAGPPFEEVVATLPEVTVDSPWILFEPAAAQD
jgi:hypothetical protein